MKPFMRMEVYISKETPKMENVMEYGPPINQMELLKVKNFLKRVLRLINANMIIFKKLNDRGNHD